MPGQQRVPMNPSSLGSGLESAPPTREDPKFKAAATLLVLANIATGVFAALAGQKVGNEHLDYVIAFAFLGVVVVLIFALAFIDSATRSPGDSDWEYHH